MPPPTFVFGAGFNVDARAQLGPIIGHSIHIGAFEIPTFYPLVGDLWHICYRRQAPPDESFEGQLHTSIVGGDFEPLTRLLSALARADCYIARRHAAAAELDSSYKRFLSEFAGSTFLTFNYDSLVEIILHQLGVWSPRTGFGIPVVAHATSASAITTSAVQSRVLHLHGSLCVFASTTYTKRNVGDGYDEICHRTTPEYRFDPSSTGPCFPGWRRAIPEEADVEDIRERVIAPVPDKAPLLAGHYSRCIYATATQALASNPHMVTIGYGFSASDAPSYSPLLDVVVAAQGTLTVVAPNSREVSMRLRRDHPGLSVHAVPTGFTEWYGVARI